MILHEAHRWARDHLLRFEVDGGFVFVTALRSMRDPDPDANLTYGR